MPDWQAKLDDWFSSHHGIVGRPTMAALGVPPRSISRMVERQQLITVMPGVFRSRQWPDGPHQRMAAVCARNPAALIAFTSADEQWGFRNVRDTGLHALVPHGASPELPGIIVHRCRRIDPVDIVQRGDGIRLTSPPRSLFDSADMLGFSAARSILEQILHEQMCTFATVVDTFRRLAHPNRPGTLTMTDVIRSRPAWRSALHSDLEMRILAEIERQGLPAPIAQCPVLLPTGRTIHLDFGWPAWLVGLEVDDPAWHAGFDDHRRDTNRDRKAATLGWLVPRIAKIDIETGLRESITDVALILRRRVAAA